MGEEWGREGDASLDEVAEFLGELGDGEGWGWTVLVWELRFAHDSIDNNTNLLLIQQKRPNPQHPLNLPNRHNPLPHLEQPLQKTIIAPTPSLEPPRYKFSHLHLAIEESIVIDIRVEDLG